MEPVAQFESSGVEETRAFASSLASKAWSGMIIALSGPMGAGKTAFAQGFALGLGIQEPVTSPTYAIIQEYYGGRLPLYHMDWYRLSDEDEVVDTGAEEYFSRGGVCLVEWPERGNLPDESVFIQLSIGPRGKGRTIRIYTDQFGNEFINE